MSEDEVTIRHQVIKDAVKDAIAQALSRHRKLGESIAVWQDGKVVILKGDEIPDGSLNASSEPELGPGNPSSIES